MEEIYPHLKFELLPSELHLQPGRLKEMLEMEVSSARERGEQVLCLYGRCFPDMDDFCRTKEIRRVSGNHCYEILLGARRFRRIMKEAAGTYFLERDLIMNFEEYCAKPLQLHDKEMRKCILGNYRRLVYVRQPTDPDLVSEAGNIARFLELPLEIRDVDYSHLRKNLLRLI